MAEFSDKCKGKAGRVRYAARESQAPSAADAARIVPNWNSYWLIAHWPLLEKAAPC